MNFANKQVGVAYDEQDNPQQIIVIALGKLGGELNFSSDRYALPILKLLDLRQCNQEPVLRHYNLVPVALLWIC